MGLGPSKEKILKILEKSNTIYDKDNIKLECRVTNLTIKRINENPFDLVEDEKVITYDAFCSPFTCIGTLKVQFPLSEEYYEYTCFLIYENVILTLSTHLEDKSKGGKAKTILSSFSNKLITWEHIYLQGEEKIDLMYKNENDKFEFNTNSNYALIISEDAKEEWLGLEKGEENDLSNKNLHSCLFLKQNQEGETRERDIFIIKQVKINRNYNSEKYSKNKIISGSPIFYRDEHKIYVIGVINELYDIQFLDKDSLSFIYNQVNRIKIVKQNSQKTINTDNIIRLDLSRNDFGPLDIKFVIDFELKNLKLLDLSSNSIGPQGVFYLSQGKFSNLESLSLNFNEIGDEGVNYLSTSSFENLNYLYLFHCDLSFRGIAYLKYAKFIPNLKTLSLSENPNIKDDGIKTIKSLYWANLNTLYLNSTGLGDKSIQYFLESRMPKLKSLNIMGNRFSNNGRKKINELIDKGIDTIYKPKEEKKS